jgi:hypothetical protein
VIRPGVRIERVLTDNAKNYVQSFAFADAIAKIGARHKVTRPFRPQTNGKAERFRGTLLTEWAYLRRYDTNQARLDALPGFIAYYNERRPHGSLDGQSPGRPRQQRVRETQLGAVAPSVSFVGWRLVHARIPARVGDTGRSAVVWRPATVDRETGGTQTQHECHEERRRPPVVGPDAVPAPEPQPHVR